MNTLQSLPHLELWIFFSPVNVYVGLIAACGENIQLSLLGNLFRKIKEVVLFKKKRLSCTIKIVSFVSFNKQLWNLSCSISLHEAGKWLQRVCASFEELVSKSDFFPHIMPTFVILSIEKYAFVRLTNHWAKKHNRLCWNPLNFSSKISRLKIDFVFITQAKKLHR